MRNAGFGAGDFRRRSDEIDRQLIGRHIRDLAVDDEALRVLKGDDGLHRLLAEHAVDRAGIESLRLQGLLNRPDDRGIHVGRIDGEAMQGRGNLDVARVVVRNFRQQNSRMPCSAGDLAGGHAERFAHRLNGAAAPVRDDDMPVFALHVRRKTQKNAADGRRRFLDRHANAAALDIAFPVACPGIGRVRIAVVVVAAVKNAGFLIDQPGDEFRAIPGSAPVWIVLRDVDKPVVLANVPARSCDKAPPARNPRPALNRLKFLT